MDSLDLCSAGVQKQNIKRKQLDRRDTEQAVERILNEHFAGFTRAQTDVMTVDGLTLRQTLIDRKRDKKGDVGSRLGTELYSELGRAFALESSPVRALQVKDLRARLCNPLCIRHGKQLRTRTRRSGASSPSTTSSALSRT